MKSLLALILGLLITGGLYAAAGDIGFIIGLVISLIIARALMKG